MLDLSKSVIISVILVFLINLNISHGFHMIGRHSSYDVVNNRTRRQAAVTCKSSEFRCKSKTQCIHTALLCDGATDCPDGSDETTDCRKITCPEFAFQCAYGACVDGDAECNNEKQCADGSDENTARCPKVVVNNACGKLKFTCTNGQCIDSDKMCDGKKDCSDGSDETFTTCSSFPCPNYAYQCAYGGCVNGDAKCNGVVDCADESDELPDLCGKPLIIVTETPPPVTSKPGVNGCILPEYPKDGYYNISGNVKIPAGQPIGIGSFIVVACNTGYALFTNVPTSTSVQHILCLDNSWTSPIPSCIRTCPPRTSDSVDIQCEFNGQKVDCEKPMLEGTFAKMKCKNHYENLDIQFRNTLTKCKDGSWDDNIIRCVPACGNLVPKGAQLFVVGGEDAEVGDFPWHVGIYQKSKPVITDEAKEIKHICGGSIITTRILLSAAHCYTDALNGRKYPEENYLVAAGKYHRAWTHPDDKNAQKTEVEKLLIPKDYKGLQLSYTYDIALVVVKTPFMISNLIQPVCLDWANLFEEEQLRSDAYGEVAGWGLTQEGGQGSDNLKELKVPFIDKEECEDLAPPDFRNFITPDKICAGWTNGSSVCQGDSGGGLVFLKPDNKRYFIRGLVSSGPVKENTCDSHQIGVYTKISYHLDWISRMEKEYKSS